MTLDVLSVAAKLIGCERDEVAYAAYKEDGSLVAVNATGAKFTFPKLLITAANKSIGDIATSGDSVASASATNHTSPAAQPAATSSAGERALSPARSPRKGKRV
jgi:hypothetical protein